MSELHLVISGRRAGRIVMPPTGRPELHYAVQYAQADGATPLSTRFNLEQLVHAGEDIGHWLDGVLPDSEGLRAALMSRYGVESGQSLDLLGTEIGAECAGAAQFCPPDQTELLLAPHGGMHSLSNDEVFDWLDRVRRDPAYRPHGYTPLGAGFSLAGMQPKIALRRTESGWAMPWGCEPTSHIIKVTRPDPFPHEALMEHLTMTTARNMGMPVPDTSVMQDDRLEAIVVERYDRLRTADGNLVRVHQEDFCQAFGMPPICKYQRLGGPDPSGIASLLRADCEPSDGERLVQRFRDMLIFQWLVVNSDAHAKNFSLLFAGRRGKALAPLYDACTWLPYRSGIGIPAQRLALRIGRDDSVGSADRSSSVARTALNLGLDRTETAQRFAEMAALLQPALEDAVHSLTPEQQDLAIVQRYISEQTDRAEHCARIAERACRTSLHVQTRRRPWSMTPT